MKYFSTVSAIVVALMCLMSSCSAPKKVPYVEGAETLPTELLSQLPAASDPVIGVGDLLNIDVSGLNMAAVAPFNKGRYVNADGTIGTLSTNNVGSGGGGGYEVSTQYYLVDKQGDINFPVLGDVHVKGLTQKQIEEKLQNLIYPKYVTEKPSVDVRLMNFRVVVGGAVRSPGVVRSTSANLTFLEALAQSGDLDIRGDRENILLYRVNADGTRSVHRVNIHDKNFLLSPYYYLKQND